MTTLRNQIFNKMYLIILKSHNYFLVFLTGSFPQPLKLLNVHENGLIHFQIHLLESRSSLYFSLVVWLLLWNLYYYNHKGLQIHHEVVTNKTIFYLNLSHGVNSYSLAETL